MGGWDRRAGGGGGQGSSEGLRGAAFRFPASFQPAAHRATAFALSCIFTPRLHPRSLGCCRETGDGWDQEIAEDVGGECGKYGQVLHVFVDRASRGFVYIVSATDL